MNGEIAGRAISQVCKEYKIDSLMVFGGEPLLYPDDVCRIFEAGLKSGIPQREMITNGYFSKDEKRIEEVATKMIQKISEHFLSILTVRF